MSLVERYVNTVEKIRTAREEDGSAVEVDHGAMSSLRNARLIEASPGQFTADLGAWEDRLSQETDTSVVIKAEIDWPFDCVFVGCDDALDVPISMLSRRFGSSVHSHALSAYICGPRDVFEVWAPVHERGTDLHVTGKVLHTVVNGVSARHNFPLALKRLSLQILANVVTVDNSHTPGERMGIRRSLPGKVGFSPSRYYRVKISPTVVRTETGRKDCGGIQWNHRWDVRGHRRTYIRRYPKPVDPVKRSRYVKDGWTVVENLMPVEWRGELLARKLPPKAPGEWMAMKRVEIDSYVKGPAEKPYIPAVRELAK